MNILVIGKGFDLAHGLPTRYTDFLEFCKRVFPIYRKETNINYYKGDLDKWNFDVKMIYFMLLKLGKKISIGISDSISTNR